MDILVDRDAMALRAAGLIAEALTTPGPRSLVVTGGATPGPVYDRLAVMPLDWAGTTITLSDDRWVDGESPDSNARLVEERLLVGYAAQARFLGLKSHASSPESGAFAAEPALRALMPSAATLLGMGEDGHIASLFPNDPDLVARLDPQGDRLCVGVTMAGLAPFVPRITLTARALLQTGRVVIQITGEAKKAVIERVRAEPAFTPPVACLMRQDRVPVTVLWAP